MNRKLRDDLKNALGDKYDFKPLTFITGENNTGKTKILDMIENIGKDNLIKNTLDGDELDDEKRDSELDKFRCKLNLSLGYWDKDLYLLEEVIETLFYPVRNDIPTVIRHEVLNTLHPVGQAEFVSMIIDNLKDRFVVIKTHSDHMVDRAAIAIQKGILSHEDVGIINLQKDDKGNITPHNIYFADKQANLEGMPDNYRDWFLKETKEMLGFIKEESEKNNE